jgi:carbon monoxide dehydrogenase subunit G
MLRFEGDRDFGLAPAEVGARLSDARFLVHCIPDAESIKETDATTATCVLRPGFSFVRGTLDVTLKVEPDGSDRAKVLLHSKGVGSTSDVVATMTFAAHETGTRVHWSAEVTHLGGLLKLVPQGLVRGAAEKVINDVWATIEKRITEPAEK